MDIGRLKNNIKFSVEEVCPEFAEPDIILSLKGSPEFNLRIWEGYFVAVFSNPIFTDRNWVGFTRDYQEDVNGWEEATEMDNIYEYIWDMLRYKDIELDPIWEKTVPKVFNLILDFLTYAKQTGQIVIVEKDY